MESTERKLGRMCALRVVILSIVLLQSQQQAAPYKQNSKQAVQKPSVDQAIAPPRQEPPKVSAAQPRPLESQVSPDTHKEQDRAQTVKEINDTLLVIFTGLLFIVGVLQWRVLQKHEEWMKKHDARLEQLADAANENAKAAKLNAVASVSAARPWVSISGSYNSGTYTFTAINYGNTPAEIVSYSANFTFVDRVENLTLPPEYKNWKKPSFALLSPGGTTDGAALELGTYDTNTIIISDRTKPIMIFYFRILYKNPIESGDPSIRNHESRMCFWYRSKSGQYPQVGGPQDYNKHT